MSVGPKGELDRAIDEVLASMVGGEPRQVSGASIRVAADRRRPSLSMWLAAAAVLVVALGVALKEQRPLTPEGESASKTEAPHGVEPHASPSAEPGPSIQTVRTRRAPVRRDRPVQVFTEGSPEGLPRLLIASIDLPEPLRTSPIDADPIQIPRIEIAPLSVSSLSTEQEHK